MRSVKVLATALTLGACTEPVVTYYDHPVSVGGVMTVSGGAAIMFPEIRERREVQTIDEDVVSERAIWRRTVLVVCSAHGVDLASTTTAVGTVACSRVNTEDTGAPALSSQPVD